MKTILILLLCSYCFSLKVLQFNIYEGGRTGILNHLAVIRKSNADIINISEAYYTTSTNFYRLRDSLGFYAHLSQNANYSEGLLSRYPIIDSTKIPSSTYSWIAGSRNIILVGTDTVVILGTHLYPLDNASSTLTRRTEATYYSNWIRNYYHYPVIWLGDFNSRDRSEGLDSTAKVEYVIPAIKDSLYDMRFRDCYRIINPSFLDSGVTFPSTRGRLDYVFVNSYWNINTCTVLDSTYSPWSSDHYAVLVDLTILPAKNRNTKTLLPNADSYISGSATTTNYGTNQEMIIGGSAPSIAYLKFITATIDRTRFIDSVCVRIKSSAVAGANSSNAGNVFKITDNSWTETGITYSNAVKTFTDTVYKSTDTIGMVRIKSFRLRNSDVLGDTLTIAINNPSALNDAARYQAREYTSEPPRMFIYYHPLNETRSKSSQILMLMGVLK